MKGINRENSNKICIKNINKIRNNITIEKIIMLRMMTNKKDRTHFVFNLFISYVSCVTLIILSFKTIFS